jgi:hypothetical protein
MKKKKNRFKIEKEPSELLNKIKKIAKIGLLIFMVVIIIFIGLYIRNRSITQGLNSGVTNILKQFDKDKSIIVTVNNSSDIDEILSDTILSKNSEYKLKIADLSKRTATISGKITIYNTKNRKYFNLDGDKEIQSNHFGTLFMIEFPSKYCKIKYYDNLKLNISDDSNLKLDIKSPKHQATIFINNRKEEESINYTLYTNFNEVTLDLIKKASEKVEALKPYVVLKKPFYVKYECNIPYNDSNVILGIDTFQKTVLNSKMKN